MGPCSMILKLSLGSSFLGEGDPKLLLLLRAEGGASQSPGTPHETLNPFGCDHVSVSLGRLAPDSKSHGVELSAVC